MQPEVLPTEYISLRSVWLSQINRCNDAFSRMAISDANLASSEADVGSRNACYSVDALFYSLVDYGEAKVLSEVTKWRNKKHLPELSEIWKSSGSDKAGWNKSAKLSMKLFHHILEVLNKYQMLFPEQPLGYSNVEMKSV